MSSKVALITGITGQDGAYLADFLLVQGYIVHGVKRRASLLNTERIDYLYRDRHDAGVRLFLHYGDMTDSTNLLRLLGEIKPDEVYNLAAQSHVQVSFETPEYTANTDALGALRLLEAMVSRTPVMGLNRNGLPEIVDGGRHGFLVDRAEPAALAKAMLCALSDPDRLARMAAAAQRHALENYSWNRVAERIAYS